jgi:hypothetical protein
MGLELTEFSICAPILIRLRIIWPTQRSANSRFQRDFNSIPTNVHCAFVSLSTKQCFGIFYPFSSYFAKLLYCKHGAGSYKEA